MKLARDILKGKRNGGMKLKEILEEADIIDNCDEYSKKTSLGSKSNRATVSSKENNQKDEIPIEYIPL